MSSPAGPTHEPMVGEDVMLLVHTDDRPTWAVGRIHARNPFTVEFEGTNLALFKSISSLMVLHDSGRKYTKGEGKISDVYGAGEKGQITFTDFRWESVDNRDNPRFDVAFQTVVRTITEAEHGIQADDQVGVTKNMSLGGALIQLSAPVGKGQLVEFRVTLEPGQTIRAMGVVAHTSEDGTLIGVNFIDYIGAARYTLHQFLSKLAA